ncbi:methyl-accepting chemotaxis protein [Curvibacter sp. CHRR-16]|uniref:methyl-accepting chemotaxis protein n=1 Tax=Curvibacter sp. CHRR-16 TaxID=2835872 RepID=UPI002023B404|nr:methyl-accepting chemotaxis protein [Curvibacter sp. CHRR-16]
MKQSMMAPRFRTNGALLLLFALSLFGLLAGPVSPWVHVAALVTCMVAWVRWRGTSAVELDQATLPGTPATEPNAPPPTNANEDQTSEQTVRLGQLVAACVEKMEAATELARRSGGRVEQGASTMHELRGAIAEMDRHLRDSSQAFDDLQRRAARISAVVEDVKQIARQTNLLAINAAIEAARAGPTGKGFSVVSGEVKMLAGRSDDAAAEIGRLAEALSSACAGAQAQVEQMKQVSARGITHSAAVHEVFTDIQNGAAQRVQTVAAVFADLRAQQVVLEAMRRDI